MKTVDGLRTYISKPLLIFDAVFLIAFLITFAILALFPEYIKIQGTIDLMKALVDVDGVLLGFVGIVYAQLFSSVMDQQNTIFEKMLSNPKQYSRYDGLQKEYSKRKKNLVWATLATFSCLLISILISLVGIGRVSIFDPAKDTYTVWLAFFPMLFLVLAVVVLVYALVGLPTEPPKSPEGQIQTTLQEQSKP
jgi:hypothetical protein